MEDNHETTIDVSTYTDPVEVTPAQGKDGIKKATITLENIPSGGDLKAYRWKDSNNIVKFFNFDKAPMDANDFIIKKNLTCEFGWTSRTSGVSTVLRSVTYSKTLGLFVAVGASGTIITSLDGITWTSRISGVSTTLYSVTYSETLGLFVAVGQSGVILTSSDGITWTSRTSGISTLLWSVTYSETLGLFVAVGNAGTIRTSPDGITWTGGTSGVSTVLYSVTYSESLDLFVIAAGSGVILTSYIKCQIQNNEIVFDTISAYTKTSDIQFAITTTNDSRTYTRDSSGDIAFW